MVEPSLEARKYHSRCLLEEGEKQQKDADRPPATSAPFEEALNTKRARRRRGSWSMEGVVLERGACLGGLFSQAALLTGEWR